MRSCAIFIAIATLALSNGAGAMELSSPSIADGAGLSTDQVKDGCGGRNISPALSWSGAPANTKSFALTVFDPDAQGGWWHWAVFGIPASAHGFPAGAGSGQGLPSGAVQAKNDFGDATYGGACPPPGSGPHHYQFVLWALPDSSIPLGADAKAEQVASYVKSHALAHAELKAVYER